MYVKLEEVVYIHPQKYRPIVDDRVAFERDLNGNRVFTIDSQPSKHDSAPVKPAGIFFFNSNERACLVPLVWDENEAMCAKTFEPAFGFPEDETPGELGYWLKDKGFAVRDGRVVRSDEGQYDPAYIVVGSKVYRRDDSEELPTSGILHGINVYVPDGKMKIVAGPVAHENELPTVPFSVEGWFDSPFNVLSTDGTWYQIKE